MIPAITGMPNTIPAAPGLDERVKETFGRGVVIRRFRSRSPCPLDFFLMMLPVGAAHLVAPCTLLTILNRRTFGPRICLFGCLFLTEAFQSRKKVIEADEDMKRA